MGYRHSFYGLENMAEFDKGLITTENVQKTKSKLKRGRRSQKKRNIVVG